MSGLRMGPLIHVLEADRALTALCQISDGAWQTGEWPGETDGRREYLASGWQLVTHQANTLPVGPVTRHSSPRSRSMASSRGTGSGRAGGKQGPLSDSG
jgi:hypothetical protein